MRGEMPIIIAMVIIFAVIFSSLYFISTVNIGSSIRSLSYSTMLWLYMQKELDNLMYIALKYGSQTADAVFIQIYTQLAQNANGLSDLEQAVITASEQADQAMKEKVNEIISNWQEIKEKEGFTIHLKELSSSYYVGFGEGYSNVYLHVEIISYTGERRDFVKNYTVYYSLNLERTNINLLNSLLDLAQSLGLDFIPYVNLTLVFDATAYLDMNGQKYYYMLDKEDAKAVIHDFLAAILGGSQIVSYVPGGIYYYGKGSTKIIYYVDATTALIGILETVFAGDVVGATASINIDGFIARTAISIT